MLTPEEKATLAKAAKSWGNLAWFQLAIISLLAWSGMEGWAWLLWAPVFIFLFVGGVKSGSRFSITVLAVYAVLVLLGSIVSIMTEDGPVSGLHLHHVQEFALVYVAEASWTSMRVAWRRMHVVATSRQPSCSS